MQKGIFYKINIERKMHTIFIFLKIPFCHFFSTHIAIFKKKRTYKDLSFYIKMRIFVLFFIHNLLKCL